MIEHSIPLGRTTAVNLWAAAIIAVALGGWIVRDAIWKTKINHRLESIEAIVNHGVADRWTGTQMTMWSTMLRVENPELSVPEPDSIPSPLSPEGR